MAVGAAVTGQPGKHQPKAVQQLRSRAEGAADAGHAGPLVQRQRSGDVQYLVHLRLCGLRHAPPGIGGQGFQIAPGAFGIQYAQRQRGLPGAGDPGNAHDLVQRYVYIDVFQIMDPRAANLNMIDHRFLLCRFRR